MRAFMWTQSEQKVQVAVLESKCCVDSSRLFWDIYFMADVIVFLCSYSSLKYEKQLSARHWTFWAIKSKILHCVAPTFRLDASWTHHSWMKNDSQTRAVGPSEEHMSGASWLESLSMPGAKGRGVVWQTCRLVLVWHSELRLLVLFNMAIRSFKGIAIGKSRRECKGIKIKIHIQKCFQKYIQKIDKHSKKRLNHPYVSTFLFSHNFFNHPFLRFPLFFILLQAYSFFFVALLRLHTQEHKITIKRTAVKATKKVDSFIFI